MGAVQVQRHRAAVGAASLLQAQGGAFAAHPAQVQLTCLCSLEHMGGCRAAALLSGRVSGARG